MDAFVPIRLVIQRQSLQNPQLNSRGVTVLLDRAYYLDGTFRSLLFVVGLDDLSKRALPQ